MSTHRIAILAGTVLTGATLGLAALASAGTAGADIVTQRDAAFLDNIQAEGIAYTSPQVAIQNAQKVCLALGNGQTGLQVGRQILKNTDLSAHQAAVFVVDSVKTYCPQNSGQVNA